MEQSSHQYVADVEEMMDRRGNLPQRPYWMEEKIQKEMRNCQCYATNILTVANMIQQAFGNCRLSKKQYIHRL
jgi:hypothetical protein